MYLNFKFNFLAGPGGLSGGSANAGAQNFNSGPGGSSGS